MGFCNYSMFCCALLCVHSSFAVILIGKRELVALLCLSSWCLVIVVWLFLTMTPVCLQFVIVVYSFTILGNYLTSRAKTICGIVFLNCFDFCNTEFKWTFLMIILLDNYYTMLSPLQ